MKRLWEWLCLSAVVIGCLLARLIGIQKAESDEDKKIKDLEQKGPTQ